MGASNYTYAEASWTHSPPDWIGAHTRAFEAIGGVPGLLVPDNTEVASLRPASTSRYAERRDEGTGDLEVR